MGLLEGRSAILPGASSGVGYGCALRFAEEGANVIAAARRVERLEKLRDDAASRGFPGKIVPVACDILKEADLDQLVEKCLSEFGKIDILACIAQAGMTDQHYIMDTTKENAQEFYLGGPIYTMHLIQKCIPHMKEKHYGRIITCASGAAVSPTPGFTGYGMAKAAIVDLTRLAAKEFGQFGVVTNCFLPVIKNDLFGIDPQSAAALEQLKRMIPVGYLGDAYEDCSPIVAFMASEGAHYMNGQFISICGGTSIIV